MFLLDNKISVDYYEGKVVFTKRIDNRLWSIRNDCGSCKMLFLLIKGFSATTDAQFVAEAKNNLRSS